jgi:hypothetical protein
LAEDNPMNLKLLEIYLKDLPIEIDIARMAGKLSAKLLSTNMTLS